MEAWKRLGRSIGSHMPVIVVLCVAAGVLFPRALAPLGPAVPALFAFMTFQGSLDNTLRQVVGVLRDPLPLIAILSVTLVAMPALAFLLANALFGGNADLVAGILLAYCVPIGIVSFMWVGMFSGNTALASPRSSHPPLSRPSRSPSRSSFSWGRPSISTQGA